MHAWSKPGSHRGMVDGSRRGGCRSGEPPSYLDIAWLLVVTIVLELPLLTAAVVGLTARSRRPVVARLD